MANPWRRPSFARPLGLAVRTLVLASLTAGCPPRADGQARDTPAIEGRACSRPSECRLVWTTDDVCGCCGSPRRGHAEALSGAAAQRRMDVACPACACPTDPTLFATCHARRCEVVDLETSALTACTRDDECVATPGSCGPAPLLVPLLRGREPALASALGCVPLPVSAEGAVVACERGHCRLRTTTSPDDPLP
ncbi:MAG: hypothetical protein J0L92_30635 [Deltaproteobacteria bacterium]|nr:hypothetical protein [Deltaproteobacteria bacterium]